MRASGLVTITLLAGLAACTDDGAPAAPDPDLPRPIPEVRGGPGETVRLVHRADEGDVVRVLVRPLPVTGCGDEKLVLSGPDDSETDLATLDPATRIESDGEWAWTFDPCPDDTATYTLVATPTAQHDLEVGDGPVLLDEHATYDDAASFVVPTEGRTILLGTPRIVLDPEGQRLVFAPGSRRLAFDGATQAGTYTVLGEGEFEVVRPVEVSAELDRTLDLEAPEGRPVGEFEVSFTVPEDTWLTAPLRGWAADEGALATLTIEAGDGSSEGTRAGGGRDGLWHLTPGDYTARVAPGATDSTGSLTLARVTPTEITKPGDHVLSTGAGGEPAVAFFDLSGVHPISVLEDRGDPVPWTLTWGRDAEAEPCVSALDCMASRGPTIPSTLPVRQRIKGRGFLALATEDGARHSVTVRIGQH